MQLVCTAISEHAAAVLASPGALTLCSRFTHVVNFCRDNTVISIQTPDIPKTPLSLVLSRSSFQWLHSHSDQLQRAETRNGMLLWDEAQLMVERAALYRSQLLATKRPLNQVPYRSLCHFALILAKPDSFVFLPQVLQKSSRNCTDVQQYAGNLLDSAGIHELIGLGGGLTPSGDDFLVGVLAVLRWLGRVEWETRLAAEIDCRLGKTTLISRAFLERALKGEFSQPVLALFDALENGSEEVLAPAVSKLCAVGHTSGSDLLGGVLWTLNQIIKQEGHK